MNTTDLTRLLLAFVAVSTGQPLMAQNVSADAKHVIVYQNDKEFAGWPANEGLWQWGDEVLVAFEVSAYSEKDNDHNINRNAVKRIAFARSHDGGFTWKAEDHPEIGPPEYLGDPDRHLQKAPGVAKPVTSPGGFDFSSPDFAMKIRGSKFYVSENRGRKWKGPFLLPNFGMDILSARTNYVSVDANTCRLFLSGKQVVSKTDGFGRSMMVETVDGGKTFRRVSWLTEHPQTFDGKDGVFPAYSIMPGVTSMPDNSLLTAVRCRRGKHHWNDLTVSLDHGRTWAVRSRPVDHNNNPSSLVALGGTDLAILYGKRGKDVKGICAKLSSDAGLTWSDEVILRDDAREWDLGYVRACLRSDGCILVVYYYTTNDHPANFIGATIWKPSIERISSGTFE